VFLTFNFASALDRSQKHTAHTKKSTSAFNKQIYTAVKQTQCELCEKRIIYRRLTPDSYRERLINIKLFFVRCCKASYFFIVVNSNIFGFVEWKLANIMCNFLLKLIMTSDRSPVDAATCYFQGSIFNQLWILIIIILICSHCTIRPK
jgi:hypothetical protein